MSALARFHALAERATAVRPDEVGGYEDELFDAAEAAMTESSRHCHEVYFALLAALKRLPADPVREARRRAAQVALDALPPRVAAALAEVAYHAAITDPPSSSGSPGRAGAPAEPDSLRPGDPGKPIHHPEGRPHDG